MHALRMLPLACVREMAEATAAGRFSLGRILKPGDLSTPKKSKDRLRWGHAIAVVVQKRLGLFPGYVWKQPEMAFLTRFASLLSSASV